MTMGMQFCPIVIILSFSKVSEYSATIKDTTISAVEAEIRDKLEAPSKKLSLLYALNL